LSLAKDTFSLAKDILRLAMDAFGSARDILQYQRVFRVYRDKSQKTLDKLPTQTGRQERE
jgi:hypothetical protein